MNGISSGRRRLKMTRPTVVSISVLSTSWTSACDDVLVVVLRRQVDVAAGVADADRRVGLDVALLVARA